MRWRCAWAPLRCAALRRAALRRAAPRCACVMCGHGPLRPALPASSPHHPHHSLPRAAPPPHPPPPAQVAMPDGGLITPVIKDADSTDLYTMSRSWADLVRPPARPLRERACASGLFWAVSRAWGVVRGPLGSEPTACTARCRCPPLTTRPTSDPAAAGQARACQAAEPRRVLDRHLHHLQPGHVWRGRSLIAILPPGECSRRQAAGSSWGCRQQAAAGFRVYVSPCACSAAGAAARCSGTAARRASESSWQGGAAAGRASEPTPGHARLHCPAGTAAILAVGGSKPVVTVDANGRIGVEKQVGRGRGGGGGGSGCITARRRSCACPPYEAAC